MVWVTESKETENSVSTTGIVAFVVVLSIAVKEINSEFSILKQLFHIAVILWSGIQGEFGWGFSPVASLLLLAGVLIIDCNRCQNDSLTRL